VPPTETERLHEELADAWPRQETSPPRSRRRSTRAGSDAALPLVWEWRGTLFRVRFARLRFERPRAVPAPAAVVTLSLDAAARHRRRGRAGVGVRSPRGPARIWLLVGVALAGTLAASILLRP